MNTEKKVRLMYMLLTEVNPDRLGEIVNEWIADGWEPLGGVAITSLDDVIWCAQAMVKRS